MGERTRAPAPLPPPRVSATAAALEVLRHLEAVRGPLIFFQSGGCCEGSAPMCVPAGDMAPGPADRRLGQLSGTPVYIDADQDDRWGRPHLVIDVRPGAGDSFSLEGLEGVHFLTCAASRDAPPPA